MWAEFWSFLISLLQSRALKLNWQFRILSVVLFVVCVSFLLTEVILVLPLLCNRTQDPGREHCINTRADKQDNTQVGKKNCTNQQLWYGTAIMFNYVHIFIWFVIMIYWQQSTTSWLGRHFFLLETMPVSQLACATQLYFTQFVAVIGYGIQKQEVVCTRW